MAGFVLCVLHSATDAVSELKAKVERCGAGPIIAPLTAATTIEKHQADKVDRKPAQLVKTYNVMKWRFFETGPHTIM